MNTVPGVMSDIRRTLDSGMVDRFGVSSYYDVRYVIEVTVVGRSGYWISCVGFLKKKRKPKK